MRSTPRSIPASPSTGQSTDQEPSVGFALVLCLAIPYIVFWGVLGRASDAFWYLPAGLRLALICLTPRRFWPWLWVVEFAALGLAQLQGPGDPAHTGLSLAGSLFLITLNLFGPMACYLTAVYFVTARGRWLASVREGNMERLIPAAVLAACANSLLLWLRDAWLAGVLDQPLIEPLRVYAIGDFIGCLAVAPPLIAVIGRLAYGRAQSSFFPSEWLGAVPGLIGWAGVTFFEGEDRLLTLVVAVGSLFAVAYWKSWRAASFGVLALSVVAQMLSKEGGAPAQPWILQILVGAVGVGALLLGGAVEALRRRIYEAVMLGREVLMARDQLQAASTRLVDAEEQERLRLARELHDGIGQNLSALRARVHLLKRGLVPAGGPEALQSIDDLASSAQDELRAALQSLNPVELDRLGFARALSEGTIATMLADLGIEFECALDPRIDLFPTLARGLYRVCQEAANNAAKAGRASRFSIQLRPIDGKIELCIGDDGGPIHLEASLGQGLQSIRDRATAIGAAYTFDPASGHPRHRLVLGIPS